MATKKTVLTKDKIVSYYMDHVVEHNENQNQFTNLLRTTDLAKPNFTRSLEHLKLSRKKFSFNSLIKPSNC